MKTVAAMIFCIFSLTCFAQKQKTTTNKRFAGLDTVFARVLKEWKAAGFAVAVVEKDKIVYAKGFGYKDWEHKIPVTENTLFAIGSCTKAFTASLIGLLTKDGKVDLDKPVRTYLPALVFYNNYLTDNITLRDMMCHRTGLPRDEYSSTFFPTQSKDTLMWRLQYTKPVESIRNKFEYNNYMYMLQGLVVEKLSGKTWEDNIRENLFQPLGMNNSNTSLNEWIQNKDIAIGYGLKNDSVIDKMDYYDFGAMAAAASINSSVNDMAKWLTLWIGGGQYKGTQVLPPQYVKEAISSQMVVSGALPKNENPDIYMLNYGLGWFISSYRGHYKVEHHGGTDGFGGLIAFYPSDSIGLVVLCNQNIPYVLGPIRDLLSDRMLGLKYKDWESEAYNKYLADKVKAKKPEKSVVNSQKKQEPEPLIRLLITRADILLHQKKVLICS